MAKANNLAAFADAIASGNFVVTFGKRSGDQRSISIPVADFPSNSLMAIFAYGVQRKFNDAVGGSDMTVDAKFAEAEKMIERFKSGDIGRRAAASTDPVADRMARIFRQLVKANLPEGVWAAEWKDAEDLDDRLEAKLAEQSDEFRAGLRATAEEEIAAEAAAKAKVGKLAVKL